LGWNLLRNQSFVITRDTDVLQVIGVDNASCKGQGFQTIYRADLPKAMQTFIPSPFAFRLSPHRPFVSSPFKILLSHDPSHWRAEVVPLTDIPLTLSGHTHAGQMRFLGYPMSSLMFSDSEGWYQEGDQSLYINTGIGCTLPVRIGVPAEITVITLRNL
jgi:predicted MPP superfamily phosphohydrolase